MSHAYLKIFSLHDLQEILGNVIEETEDSVTLKQARMIRIVPKGPDEYGVTLIPLSMTTPDGTHKIYKSAIAAEALDPIPTDLENLYIRQALNIEIVPSLVETGLK